MKFSVQNYLRGSPHNNNYHFLVKMLLKSATCLIFLAFVIPKTVFSGLYHHQSNHQIKCAP